MVLHSFSFRRWLVFVAFFFLVEIKASDNNQKDFSDGRTKNNNGAYYYDNQSSLNDPLYKFSKKKIARRVFYFYRYG